MPPLDMPPFPEPGLAPGTAALAAHPSARLYVTVWAVLLVLTGATVGVTYLDMKHFALFTALLVASTKAGLVALYFMHLRFEARIYSVLLSVALVTLAVFLALTFADIGFRYP